MRVRPKKKMRVGGGVEEEIRRKCWHTAPTKKGLGRLVLTCFFGLVYSGFLMIYS